MAVAYNLTNKTINIKTLDGFVGKKIALRPEIIPTASILPKEEPMANVVSEVVLPVEAPTPVVADTPVPTMFNPIQKAEVVLDEPTPIAPAVTETPVVSSLPEGMPVFGEEAKAEEVVTPVTPAAPIDPVEPAAPEPVITPTVIATPEASLEPVAPVVEPVVEPVVAESTAPVEPVAPEAFPASTVTAATPEIPLEPIAPVVEPVPTNVFPEPQSIDDDGNLSNEELAELLDTVVESLNMTMEYVVSLKEKYVKVNQEVIKKIA